jgi:nicotinamide-nucleotide amidase
MRIATLSIGDEVVFGEIIDTNAPHIAASLYEVGLKVKRHLTVGDVEQDIIDAILTLAASSDVVIATGGLGPTIDDLTARAAAKASDRRLVLNETALEHLREFLARRGRSVTPSNEKQALIPAKSVLIPNPTGTACGFNFQLNGCLFFFLPGVPSEMVRMVDESVIPMIRERHTGQKIMRIKVLKVFGIPEAELDSLLKGVVEKDSPVTVAFQVSFPEILVKLRAEGDDEPETVRALDMACRRVREILLDRIFAEDEDTIDTVLADLFREKGFTLSLAESCTGGFVAKRITDSPGCSDYFLEGAVTYSNAAKVRILGLSSQLLEEKGAVSSEVAMAMARGMRKLSGSDISLAITGIAGPDGGSDEKPTGTVYFALATRSGCQSKMYRFSGTREQIRTIATFMALILLRRHLLGQQ